MKHANVAIFVPHRGCPHGCSFCSQNRITGQDSQPSPQDVKETIEKAKKNLGKESHNAEIAFFGGSFTAIERSEMISLLKAASPYVKNGDFAGIRISTRPDAIDDEVLDILKEYGVTAIELGAQSMADDVLEANRRGHTSLDVINASELIRKRGFSLGLQMMTGLYRSTDWSDRMTAQRLAMLKPDTMRIYPTVVLRGTELYDLYQRGEFVPQTLDQAVGLCADLLQFFEEKGINVIRLGLHDSESLRENMAAGAYHPALRELCEGELMYRSTAAKLREAGLTSGRVEFYVAPSSVSRFIGQKRKNLDRLKAMGITPIVRQDGRLKKYEIRAVAYNPLLAEG